MTSYYLNEWRLSSLTHICTSRPGWVNHYIDVIMTTMASQITSLTVVYSTVYSDSEQRKHLRSASLAFVWGIHRDRWIPRTKGQSRGKCFHLMTSSCFHVRCSNFKFMRPMSVGHYRTIAMTSQEHRGVSNHLQFDYLWNSLFKLRIKRAWVLQIISLLWGEPTGYRWIPLTNGQ